MKRSISRQNTEVDVDKTVAEIHKMLALQRAQAVLIEYDGNGSPSAIAFRIQTEYGLIPFRLPARVGQVAKVMTSGRRMRNHEAWRDQAARTAWRIIRDWLEAQLAMIQAGLVTLVEVFLPYAQDQQGRTFYELAKETKFQRLLLPSGEGQ